MKHMYHGYFGEIVTLQKRQLIKNLKLWPNVIKIFGLKFTNFRRKQDWLSLASL
jgi:hypothetical protein